MSRDTSSAIRLRLAHRRSYGTRVDDRQAQHDDITRPIDTARHLRERATHDAEPRPRALTSDVTRKIPIEPSRAEAACAWCTNDMDHVHAPETSPRSLAADATRKIEIDGAHEPDGEPRTVARLRLAKISAWFGKIGAFVAILFAAGCLGDFNKPGPEGSIGGDGPVTLPDGTVVGARTLRRLTPSEYDATVREVFALGDAWPGAGLSPDASSALGFDNDASLTAIDESRSAELVAAAEKIADQVSQKLGCSGRACAEMIVDTYGPRLFRRALAADDRMRYLTAYDELAKLSAGDAIKWTLVALLDSPHFLYRFELGVASPDGTYRLSGEELASALAYSFTGAPPSPTLLDKGRSGALDGADARVTEARALLDSPRGHAAVDAFMRKWLRYEDVRTLVKDAAAVPDFAVLRDDMAEETRRFLDDAVFARQGKLGELFTSADTFVSPRLAQHYGLPAPGGAFARVTRPAEQSLGLLSQGSLLSRFALTHSSSPPQRGAFVRRRVLCQDLPAPPPNAGTPPVPQPGLTTRELYEKLHSAQSACAGCHQKIDPIGFGLEAFDTAGRWRSTESGKPIDAHGMIASFGTRGDVSFSNARGLAQELAASPEVAQCVGGLISAWTFGSAGARSYSTRTTLGDSSIKEFVAQLAAAPHFALRAP